LTQYLKILPINIPFQKHSEETKRFLEENEIIKRDAIIDGGKKNV